MHNNFERSSRNASAESNQRSRLRQGYGVAGRGSPRRMERAGWSRHRSHNLRREGERAGCERINPSVGRSEVREGRLLTSILSSTEEERKESALPTPFGPGGAACFTVYVAFKSSLNASTERGGYRRRDRTPHFAAVVVTPDSPVTSSALLIALARVFAVPRPQ